MVYADKKCCKARRGKVPFSERMKKLSGAILVLSGLQEVQGDSTESKSNVLSGIPYLGKRFFSPKTVKYTPTELMIFLRPTIMKPGFDDSDINTRAIDKRIDANYAPKFSSPSGRILGMPDLDDKRKGVSSLKDLPSDRPEL